MRVNNSKLRYILPSVLSVFVICGIFTPVITDNTIRLLSNIYIVNTGIILVCLFFMKKFETGISDFFRKSKEKISFKQTIFLTFSLVFSSYILGLKDVSGMEFKIMNIGTDRIFDFFSLVIKYPDELIKNKDFFNLYSSLIFILYVIIVPLATELLYRGLILSRVMYRFTPITGAIISSFIFGGGYGNFFHSFLLGYVMSIVYTQTESLRLPVMINMGYSFMFTMLARSMFQITNYYCIIVLFILSIISLFYILYFSLKNHPV